MSGPELPLWRKRLKYFTPVSELPTNQAHVFANQFGSRNRAGIADAGRWEQQAPKPKKPRASVKKGKKSFRGGRRKRRSDSGT